MLHNNVRYIIQFKINQEHYQKLSRHAMDLKCLVCIYMFNLNILWGVVILDQCFPTAWSPCAPRCIVKGSARYDIANK